MLLFSAARVQWDVGQNQNLKHYAQVTMTTRNLTRGLGPCVSGPAQP